MVMMRKKFCCDASKDQYESYYLNQSGGGQIPIFVGGRGQKGHGLGSLLSGLFRSAFPMIKRGLTSFGKLALKTGLEVVNDVVDGQSTKESAMQRLPQGIKRFAQSENFINQSGSGVRRKRRRKASTKKSKSKRTASKRKRDIFN